MELAHTDTEFSAINHVSWTVLTRLENIGSVRCEGTSGIRLEKCSRPQTLCSRPQTLRETPAGDRTGERSVTSQALKTLDGRPALHHPAALFWTLLSPLTGSRSHDLSSCLQMFLVLRKSDRDGVRVQLVTQVFLESEKKNVVISSLFIKSRFLAEVWKNMTFLVCR